MPGTELSSVCIILLIFKVTPWEDAIIIFILQVRK